MKNFLMTLFISAMLLVSSFAFADFSVPTPTGYVTDTTGKLSVDQVSQLNQRLTDYQRNTKNEIAVLMVPSLNGEDLSDVTHKVFKTYRVGKAGLDNGVVLFIAVNDHKTRLQTGSGIEGEITDIQSNEILVSMRPAFRAGNFYAGISTALDQIQAKLDNRTGQKVAPGQGQQFNTPIPQVAPNSNATATKTNQADCSVGGDLGNAVGWGFGILTLFVAGIALARRLVRKNEERKMAALEAKVEREMAQEQAEKAAKTVPLVTVNPVATRQVILPPPPQYQVEASASPIRFDEPPVRLPSHDKAAAETRRLDREAAERAEAAKAEARRLRLKEEERAAAREREREREDDTSSTVAAVVLAETIASILEDNSSSGSSSSSDWGSSSGSGFDWGGGSDSGFGGGDSGGGGSSSDW